jgi:hypothetical protein
MPGKLHREPFRTHQYTGFDVLHLRGCGEVRRQPLRAGQREEPDA